jgi:hypothetical protein
MKTARRLTYSLSASCPIRQRCCLSSRRRDRLGNLLRLKRLLTSAAARNAGVSSSLTRCLLTSRWNTLKPILNGCLRCSARCIRRFRRLRRSCGKCSTLTRRSLKWGVLIPTAPPEFTIAPLLKVPPASRGEPRTGSVPPACRGNLKEGVSTAVFCELWLGDWYYSFGELQSLLGEDARLMLPSEVASRLSNSQFTFRKWEVGIEFIKRDGLGTAHYFVPLEVLLGLRDY